MRSIGLVLMLLVSCALTFSGSVFFFYLANNTRGASDARQAFGNLILVTLGVGCGVVTCCLTRKFGLSRFTANALGLVFTVTALATLVFGIQSLSDVRIDGVSSVPEPPNLPLPPSIPVCALFSGLEIVAALVWLIASEKTLKGRDHTSA